MQMPMLMSMQMLKQMPMQHVTLLRHQVVRRSFNSEALHEYFTNLTPRLTVSLTNTLS